jgi:transglutaminase-like putative cysteine protease
MRNTRISEHRIYQLNNERASDMAQFGVGCSKWEKLTDFNGQVTDATGKVIRKFKKGELKRSELSSGFAEDIYTLSLDYTPPSYPITIEFNWVTEANNGNFGFPTFTPVEAYNTQVDHASYVLTAPAEMACRYLCRNTAAQVTQSTSGDGRIRYEAHMDNLPAIDSEPYSPPARETLPHILWAPGKFEFHGVPGDMTTWQGFGAWNHSLLTGQQELSPEFQAQLHAMTDTCTSDRSKVDVIYRYLAQTTRYVSIQLGIGGWQPFPASEVCRTGFGDCKGLTNYLCAMMHEVGLPANYVVIGSGRRHLDTEFPSNQFNHVIAQVPLPGDTLWLECTASAFVPLGYVHESIAGKDALLIDDKGGHLVKLPNYSPEQNVSYNRAHVTLQDDGSATVDVNMRYECRQYEDMLPLKSRTEQQRRDAMLGGLNLSAVTLGDFTFTELKDSYATPHIDVSMQLEARKLANITGSRMFIPVGIFHQVTVPRALQQRVQPISIDYGYVDIDSMVITIPEGFVIEALPQQVNEVTPLGELSQTFEAGDNTITIVTRHLMLDGRYPATEYNALRNFKTAVKKAYDQRIVLRRK